MHSLRLSYCCTCSISASLIMPSCGQPFKKYKSATIWSFQWILSAKTRSKHAKSANMLLCLCYFSRLKRCKLLKSFNVPIRLTLEQDSTELQPLDLRLTTSNRQAQQVPRWRSSSAPSSAWSARATFGTSASSKVRSRRLELAKP